MWCGPKSKPGLETPRRWPRGPDSRPRRWWCVVGGEGGASLVEFTLVAGLLFTLVFGIVEFGLAFRDRLTVSNATQGAVRVGSALGSSDDSDFEVLLSLEQSLSTLPNSGLDVIRFVDIFEADAFGDPTSGCPGAGCNRYAYTPVPGPPCDWTPCPDPSLGVPAYGGAWVPSGRDDALPGLDVMGVQLTFSHTWVTGGIVPLPNVDCDGSPGSRCWADLAIMRIEPQVFEP